MIGIWAAKSHAQLCKKDDRYMDGIMGGHNPDCLQEAAVILVLINWFL
jgi:hypothetical protein